MIKTLSLTLATTAMIGLASTPTLAQYTGPQGEKVISTVSSIKMNAKDDQDVTLQGYIIKKMDDNDDRYIFKDDTAQIVVEIDDEEFAGQSVSDVTPVEITGEVDKEMMQDIEIDVESVTIITE